MKPALSQGETILAEYHQIPDGFLGTLNYITKTGRMPDLYITNKRLIIALNVYGKETEDSLAVSKITKVAVTYAPGYVMMGIGGAIALGALAQVLTEPFMLVVALVGAGAAFWGYLGRTTIEIIQQSGGDRRKYVTTGNDTALRQFASKVNSNLG